MIYYGNIVDEDALDRTKILEYVLRRIKVTSWLSQNVKVLQQVSHNLKVLQNALQYFQSITKCIAKSQKYCKNSKVLQ